MVLLGRSALSVSRPPASAGQRPVPRPDGAPLPSACTSVSHAAISSGSAGRPTLIFEGFSAAFAATATRTPSATSAAIRLAELDILDLTIAAHQPALDAVVVVNR